MTKNPPIPENVSVFMRHVLMKSNKRCVACQLICFEDEVMCPECAAYIFEPYTKHLDNYNTFPDEKLEKYVETELY